MNTQPISPAMGTRVTGLDLHRATADLAGELRALLLEHHLVVVAGQDLHKSELHAFGELWGELLTHPSSKDSPTPYVQTLASSGEYKGRAFGAWHSDMSWHPTPPWITMLHARTTPAWGGDTGYANQHLAWESLDQAAKDTRRACRRELPNHDMLETLRAFHSGKGFGPDVPDSTHPVARTHDETGRVALYVNPEFTTHITDVDPAQSAALLWPLWMHAITQEFSYRHQWAAGDLVIWDNRSVMHTAILDYTDPRAMSRVVVKGETPV